MAASPDKSEATMAQSAETWATLCGREVGP
jgi:hypothetical protein